MCGEQRRLSTSVMIGVGSRHETRHVIHHVILEILLYLAVTSG